MFWGGEANFVYEWLKDKKDYLKDFDLNCRRHIWISSERYYQILEWKVLSYFVLKKIRIQSNT